METKTDSPAMEEYVPALRIKTYQTSFGRRVWNLIKNPFTYLFKGTYEI